MDVIQVGTGLSIQVVVMVVGGTIAFGVGALKWIDGRIGKVGESLKTEIHALDERYRSDRLHLENRIARLETQTQTQWPPQFHAVNGQ